jgi:capsule polysaccharide export protein KpsE/RkpR
VSEKEKQEKENEKIAALEQRATKAEADLKKAQETNTDQKQHFEALSAELDAVKAELKAKADQEHAGHVEQAYRASVEAGITGEF